MKVRENTFLTVEELEKMYRNVDSFREATAADNTIRHFIINILLQSKWKFSFKERCVYLETRNEQVENLLGIIRRINNKYLPYWQYQTISTFDKKQNALCFKTQDVFKNVAFGQEFDYVKIYITFYSKSWKKILYRINQFNLKIVDYTEYCSFLEKKVNQLNGLINALSVEKEKVIQLQQSILQ